MTSIENVENVNLSEGVAENTSAVTSNEEKTHHSHHHKSHHHHSSDGKHHSHHHHHSSSRGKSHGHHNKRKKVSSNGYHFYTTEHTTRAPITKTGIVARFKALANSLNADTKDAYVRISRRILFCVVVGIICTYSVYNLVVDDKDDNMWKADFTASETSQLKSRVSQLEDQNEELESLLESAREIIDKYTELYGELPQE